MRSRILLGSWAATVILFPVALVTGMWVEALHGPCQIMAAYLVSPIVMASVEMLARGHTQFTAWFWGDLG